MSGIEAVTVLRKLGRTDLLVGVTGKYCPEKYDVSFNRLFFQPLQATRYCQTNKNI